MNETISLKGIIDEDFVNYKVPSMTLMFPYCDYKCDKEQGYPVCQNDSISNAPIIKTSIRRLCKRYTANKINRAIVCQGLEPLDSFDELHEFIRILRNDFSCTDDVVIYTGYYEEEVVEEISKLSQYSNIIVKFGRFLPDQKPHYDKVLQVKLASDNQYAKKIS